MPYPHGDDCRCPDLPPDAGLLAFTVDCDHHDTLLAALVKMGGRRDDPAPAEVVPLRPEPACDGSMTCDCDRCEADRRARAKQARRVIRQPWELAA